MIPVPSDRIVIAYAPPVPAPVAAPVPAPGQSPSLAATLSPVEGAPASPPPPSPKAITVDEAKRLLDAREAGFVDARVPTGFVFGHVPGAVNLPDGSFDAAFAARGAGLDPAKPVVVYCGDYLCGEAAAVAAKLAAKGFSTVLHMSDGWQAWSKAALPRERGFGAAK